MQKFPFELLGLASLRDGNVLSDYTKYYFRRSEFLDQPISGLKKKLQNISNRKEDIYKYLAVVMVDSPEVLRGPGGLGTYQALLPTCASANLFRPGRNSFKGHWHQA